MAELIQFILERVNLICGQGLLLILLTISNIIGTTFRFKAYKHASASYVTMIVSLTPLIVLLLAIPILGEKITLIQMFGGILIILAGVFVEKLKI